MPLVAKPLPGSVTLVEPTPVLPFLSKNTSNLLCSGVSQPTEEDDGGLSSGDTQLPKSNFWRRCYLKATNQC